MLSLGHSQTQEQKQDLSLQQRLLHRQGQELVQALRQELVQIVRLDEYKPKSHCPECRCQLTEEEILRGFNQDSNDFTTQCPKCKKRFSAQMVCDLGYTTVSLPFFCACQTVARLEDKGHLSPRELCHDHPALYRSAIIHFGKISKAFEEVGISYSYEEINTWQQKALPFLGMLADTMIAEILGVTVAKVNYLRKKMGVPRYTLREIAEMQE